MNHLATAMLGLETVLRRACKCCVCQRPPESIERWNNGLSLDITFVFRCRRAGHLPHDQVFAVAIDEWLLRAADPGRFWKAPSTWWLLHPFPRSVARFGEVSAAARRERRLRVGRRRGRTARAGYTIRPERPAGRRM